MTDLSLDPSGVARRTLDEVVRDHGPAALDDPKLLGQLLPDLMAGAEREAALVSAAAAAGVGRALAERVGHGIPIDTAIRDIATMLATRHAYDIRACDWIVSEYARALGVPVSPSTVPVARSGQPGHEPPTTVRGPGATLEEPAYTAFQAAGIGQQPVHSQPGPATQQHSAAAAQPSTRVDASVPDAGVGAGAVSPAPRRRRTGLVVIVVAVVVVLAVAGIVLATRKSPPPKTGADCLIGSWHSTSVLVSDGTVNSGGTNITYHPGGTGDGSVNYNETLTSGDGGVVTVVASYTFNYAATDNGITYTNVQGTINTTGGSGGPDTESIGNLGDETYTCTGDTLHVDSPSVGGSQTYARD